MEQLTVGGVEPSERLNTVPLPELPPSLAGTYSVWPEKGRRVEQKATKKTKAAKI